MATKQRDRRRGAILATEFMVLAPILIGVLFLVMEMCMLLAAQQRVIAAAREGARAAATSGGQEAVAAAISRNLGPQLAPDAKVEMVHLIDSDPSGVSERSVAVEVRVQASQAAPNYLAKVGFDLRRIELAAVSVQRKE